MNILCLPNELITAIANCIGSQADCNSFAKTCRAIYPLANDSLYRYNKIRRSSSAAKWAAGNGRLGTLEHVAAAGTDITDSSLELLHYAAISGQAQVVRYLLSLEGVDVEHADESKWTAMFYACRSDAVDVIDALLSHGASATEPRLEGWRPLSIAASFDSCRATQALLRYGVDVDAQSDNLSTALKAASRGCYPAVAALLLKAKADPNIAAFGGWVPLHSAAKYGNLKLTKLLLSYNANTECRQERGYTALALAVEAEHLEIVRCLLDHGANVNATTSAGWSPLNLAADIGNVKIVKMLLERGADHSNAVSGEWASLNLAAYNGHAQVVDLLLKNGAFVDGCKGVGRTALVNTISKENLQIAETLINHGASLEVRSARGETPLMRAIRSLKSKTVHLLLERGANASTQNITGWTPLITAAHSGHDAVIDALVEASGGNVNYSDSDDRTAMIHACMRCEVKIGRKLLRNRNINLKLRDRWGSSALSMAVRNGCRQLVSDLLERLDPKDVDEDQDTLGRSVYFWARFCQDDKVLEQLREYCQVHGLRPDEDLSKRDSEAVAFDDRSCWCDVCGQCRIHNRDTRSCTVCDDGDFLICVDCRTIGASCRGKDHVWETFTCQGAV